MVAAVLTTAAAVLALLASSAAAEQMDTVSADVLRAVEDGVAAGGPDMQTRLAEMERYTGVVGGASGECIIYTEPFNPLTAGDQFRGDKRDGASGYVCSDTDPSMGTTFRATSGQERGGFTLMSISNGMDHYNDHSAWGVGWFLSVHDYYKSDTKFPGYVRVILHKVEKKAAVWGLAVLPGKVPGRDRFPFGLKLVANRGWSAAYTEGWYLAVPPDSDRDGYSNYVAVTKDPSAAAPVSMKCY